MALAAHIDPMPQRDLDNAAAIDELVETFYARVLTDPTLAPVFTGVAAIDLDTHLPRIKAFWRKMVLDERDAYRRNMVARHAAVHARFPLQRRHYDRWLALFTRTLDEKFAGPCADRARDLARNIAANLQRNLETCARAAAAPDDTGARAHGAQRR